jgi:hypothetical protein
MKDGESGSSKQQADQVSSIMMYQILIIKGSLELGEKGESTSTDCPKRQMTDRKHYLRATKPHSRIGIKFTTSLGTVQLHYLRSAIFGLGSLRCWVDEEVEKEVIVIAYWNEIYNIGKWVFLPLALVSSYGGHRLNK